MSIIRIDSTEDELNEGNLEYVVTDGDILVLDIESGTEYYEEGYRVSPKIHFKWTGEVEISLKKVVNNPIGTAIKLEISTDDGNTWESVGREGSITLTSSNIETTKMRAKQILKTNLEQIPNEDLYNDQDINNIDLHDDDDIGVLFEALFGVQITQDKTITPELNEVETEITLVDGGLRELGQLLFKGRVWAQEIDEGSI